MDNLTLFGFFAVTAMLIFYALEERSNWWTLCFAFSCALSSTYGFLAHTYPFGAVEGIWTLVALRKFVKHLRPRKK